MSNIQVIKKVGQLGTYGGIRQTLKWKSILLLLLISYPIVGQVNPDLFTSELKQTITLIKSGNSKAGIRRLNAVAPGISAYLEQTPDAGLLVLLGRAYFIAEKDSQAVEALSTAIEIDPQAAEAYFFLGLIAVFAGGHVEAEKHFRQALAISDREVKYVFELARVLDHQEKLQQALKLYEQAIALDPGHFNANYNAARILANRGHLDAAEKRFQAALAVKPDDGNTLYNLGLIRSNRHDDASAVAYFSKVVKLNPQDWRAVAKQIQTYQALGQFSARDRAIAQMYAIWDKGLVRELHKKGFYIRDQFTQEKNKIYALEYFTLQGSRPRKYVFKIHDRASNKHHFDISLGSYQSTTDYARETGKIGAQDRLYHLDGYDVNGRHYSYAFFDQAPEYDEVRDAVLRILSGKFKAPAKTSASASSQ